MTERRNTWNTNGRYHGGFPTAIRRQARTALPPHCASCGDDDTRLWLDHIINKAAGGTDTIDNAQWLCTPCHNRKTRHETARGRWGRHKRSPPPHPGRT